MPLKKTTLIKDVSQSIGLVNQGICSLMGEKDNWELGLDGHDILQLQPMTCITRPLNNP
jgi:hypothetical protein